MEGLLCSKSHFAKEFFMTSLRQRVTEDMQVRNLALNTQTSYLQQVSLFARHFEKSPEQLGPEQVRDYLSDGASRHCLDRLSNRVEAVKSRRGAGEQIGLLGTAGAFCHQLAG